MKKKNMLTLSYDGKPIISLEDKGLKNGEWNARTISFHYIETNENKIIGQITWFNSSIQQLLPEKVIIHKCFFTRIKEFFRSMM